MKKFLLSFGAIATAMTPIVAVVSCGDEDTNAQKALNNITDIYVQGADYDDIKSNLGTLAAGANIPSSVKYDAKLSSAWTADQANDEKYTFEAKVAEAITDDSTALKIKVTIKEMNGKTEVSMATKTLTAKYDKAGPTFAVTDKAVEGKKIVNGTGDNANKKGTLTFDLTADKTVKVADIVALITASDAVFGEHQVKITSTLKDVPTTAETTVSLGTAITTGNSNLVITATDALGNNASFTLDIIVAGTAS